MRKATWAIVIWTVLMVLWVVVGVQNVANEPGATETDEAFRAVSAGIGATLIFIIWFIGFVILSIIWLMSRPKLNATIYGPQGQQMIVTEKEARKRVEREGWTYQPPYPPGQPPYGGQPPYPPQPPSGGPPPGGQPPQPPPGSGWR